jgi:uncharacterized protein
LVSNSYAGHREKGTSVLRKKLLESPFKRAVQAVRILFFLPEWWKFRKRISGSCFREIAKENPAIQFKFAGKYLANFFTTRQRMKILANHYDFFEKRFADSSNRLFPGKGLPIWSKNNGDDVFSIHLAIPVATMMEGDFCLVLRHNERVSSTMTLTVLPGDVLGLDAHQALYIGGSQGSRGRVEDKRYLAKAMGEICPATLLLIAAQALGRATGISTILGISSRAHICPTISVSSENYMSAYDNFWTVNGGAPLGESFKMTAAVSTRPSTSASASHRARARRKRAIKQVLMDEMCLAFERYFNVPNRRPGIVLPPQVKAAPRITPRLLQIGLSARPFNPAIFSGEARIPVLRSVRRKRV